MTYDEQPSGPGEFDGVRRPSTSHLSNHQTDELSLDSIIEEGEMDGRYLEGEDVAADERRKEDVIEKYP